MSKHSTSRTPLVVYVRGNFFEEKHQVHYLLLFVTCSSDETGGSLSFLTPRHGPHTNLPCACRSCLHPLLSLIHQRTSPCAPLTKGVCTISHLIKVQRHHSRTCVPPLPHTTFLLLFTPSTSQCHTHNPSPSSHSDISATIHCAE